MEFVRRQTADGFLASTISLSHTPQLQLSSKNSYSNYHSFLLAKAWLNLHSGGVLISLRIYRAFSWEYFSLSYIRIASAEAPSISLLSFHLEDVSVRVGRIFTFLYRFSITFWCGMGFKAQFDGRNFILASDFEIFNFLLAGTGPLLFRRCSVKPGPPGTHIVHISFQC